eukprot:g3790.t1
MSDNQNSRSAYRRFLTTIGLPFGGCCYDTTSAVPAFSSFHHEVNGSPEVKARVYSHRADLAQKRLNVRKREIEKAEMEEKALHDRLYKREMEGMDELLADVDEKMRIDGEEDGEERDLDFAKNYVELRKTLTEKEAEKVSSVIQSHGSPNEVLVEKFKIPITRSDIKTLRPGAWLNDEVLNFYMEILQERNKQQLGKASGPEGKMTPDCHFFLSYFFTKLVFGPTGYCYSNVRRWTRKVDLFKKDIILVPINLHNSHWTWAAIFPKKKRIHYYDSMSGNGRQYLKALFRYLKDEKEDKKKRFKDSPEFEEEGWTLSSESCPQQQNGYDCGVFSAIGVMHISNNEPLNYSQRNMPFFRQHMVLSILNGVLSPSPYK